MSANSLANEAISNLQTARTQGAAPVNPDNAAALDNALSALAMYIPAEAMALYLAIMSSLPVISRDFPQLTGELIYWLFVSLFSPGLFLLAYFVKLAKADAALPKGSEFPWFRLLSSVIAFGVWGLCVPGNPFSSIAQPGRGVLFGILATVVSIVLPAVEAIYNWTRRTHPLP